MRRATGGEDEGATLERLDPLRLRAVAQLAVTQLAVAARTPCVHVAVIAESERMKVPTGDARNARVAEGLDATWDWIRLGRLTVPQLALLAIAEAVELSVNAEDESVTAAHDTHRLHVMDTRNQTWHRL